MLEQRLVAVTLSFIAGLLLGEGFSFFPLALICSTLIFFYYEARFSPRPFLSLPYLWAGAAGFLLIQLTAKPLLPGDLRAYVNRGPIRIVAQVAGAPRVRPQSATYLMEGIVIHTGEGALKAKGIFQLNIWKKDVPFRYGDQLDMVVRLRPQRQFQNFGSFQYADYRRRTGESGVAHLSDLRDVKKVGEGGNPLLKLIFRWREMMMDRLKEELRPQSAALVFAFVLGEPGYLSDEVREHFAAAGVAHLLAVSGAHLAFVSFLVFGLSRRLLLMLPPPILLRISLWKIPSQWAAAVAAVAALFYTLLAGAHLGTLRALTMILIYLGAIWIGRHGESKISLSFAALLILVFQPRALFEISFRLSFLAVASIVLAMERWGKTAPLDIDDEKRSFRKKILGQARLLFISTMAATLGTAPLTLFYFHQFSWSGLIANFVLLPLAGYLMVPMGLLSALSASFFESGLPFAQVHEFLWSFFSAIIAFFADLPGADFHFASPLLPVVAIYYVTCFYLVGSQKHRRWLFIVIGGFYLYFLGWGGLRIPPEGIRATFLDVGQGDATLIEFSNGKTLLVDGGNKLAGQFGVAPYLWERGIRTLDYVVASHPQSDHVGGLPYLMRRFRVKEFWSAGHNPHGPVFQSVLETLEARGILHRKMSREGSGIKIDDCLLRILHPGGGRPSHSENKNNQSIVLRLSCPVAGGETVSFLLTGDIETEGEAKLVAATEGLQSTILKVPHHGSRSSSGKAFISAVSPAIATISAGRNNPYRHPHPQVLADYAEYGTQLYRTDRLGAIVFEAAKPGGRNAGPGRLWSYRQQKIEPIRWNGSLFSQEWKNIGRALALFSPS